MNRLSILVLALAGALVLCNQGCQAILKPNAKAVADDALDVLRSLRGTTNGIYEPGGAGACLFDGPDSVYIDETERGVRTAGWLYYDDGDTPLDPTDDVVAFRGIKQYLDWNVEHNVWLRIHIWEGDRATEMAVRNVANNDSSYHNLGSVNRPGGIQTGIAYWTNGAEEVEMIHGVHHNETPDDWTDNYSFLRFTLTDERDAQEQFLVHADFRPDNSGSGEIRQDHESGPLIATFDWDNFGRGSLIVGGEIYPFRW